MIDTWGKFQHGILAGNVHNFGDYDQCKAFSHAKDSSNVVKGKHCMVSYVANDAKDQKFDFDFSWNEL